LKAELKTEVGKANFQQKSAFPPESVLCQQLFEVGISLLLG
jgi:hypothetical protein